jgi:hypothetical protein
LLFSSQIKSAFRRIAFLSSSPQSRSGSSRRPIPASGKRKVESLYPVYLLSQDTFLVGTLKGIGRIYMQAVVDTYGSFAFGKLYTSKLPETAVDVLYDRVLPFYEAQGRFRELI